MAGPTWTSGPRGSAKAEATKPRGKRLAEIGRFPRANPAGNHVDIEFHANLAGSLAAIGPPFEHLRHCAVFNDAIANDFLAFTWNTVSL